MLEPVQGFTDFEAMTVDILTRTLDVGSGDFEINMGIFIRPMWGIKKKVKDYTMKDIQDAKEATKVAATLKSPLPNIGGEYTNEMAIVELEKLNAMEAMLQAIQLIDEMNKDSQVPTGDEDNDAKNKITIQFLIKITKQPTLMKMLLVWKMKIGMINCIVLLLQKMLKLITPLKKN